MSSPQWTVEQQAAIELRGQILVAAAAGSGKTAVLVERLIRRITDPHDAIDVDRFLVVTFTKAAANEMRERVGKALDDALFIETDTKEVERLLHQRALLYRASITTLHSFCMEIIRQYFYQLDLDPAFRVADEAEADLLRQDTLEKLFETYYGHQDSRFEALVDAFGTDRDDQPLMEQVLRLYEFAVSQVYPEKWLEELAQAYEWSSVDELVNSAWGKATRQGISDKVGDCITLLTRAYQIATQTDGPLQYADIVKDDLARLRDLDKTLQQGTWSEVEARFGEAISFPRLPTSSKKATSKNAKNLKIDSNVSSHLEGLQIDEEKQKILREESKKARDEAKKKLEKLKMSIFSFSLEDQLPHLNEMSKLLRTLSAVVKEFAQEYASAKRLRNIVDFSDLEHFALRLLEEEEKPTSIAQNLQDYYGEVLVDEYQDINPVQERILQLVSRQDGPASNLFMVGDVKQSIYRFRMADPSLFLKKYKELPHWKQIETTKEQTTKDDEQNCKLVIDLNRNFRSRQEVIDGVNFIFRQIMTDGAGEIAYDDQAALRHGASFVNNPELNTAEGPIEFHLFDPKSIRKNPDFKDGERNNQDCLENSTEIASFQTKAAFDFNDVENNEMDLTDEMSEEPSLEELEAARIEARLVSSRIQDMVKGKEFQVYDKHLKNFRRVQYSDIIILMRSFSSVAPIYVEEFQSAGIPVYAETTSGYFGASEVETILSLLKAIDNPRQDIPLAAVLRSPLVDMNGTELGRLRSILPNGDFYEALVLAFSASQELLFSDCSDSQSPWKSELAETLNTYEKTHPELLAKAKIIIRENPELKSKVDNFWPKLQAWRKLSRRTSLADLLWQIYEETGYLAYVGTLPSGVQRQANLRVLYDRACRYEATNYRGLFRFLRFLEKFQGQGKDLGNARTIGENENVVRLLTVHSSKGLEFPVVFLVGLGTRFNTRSLVGRLLLHTELGAGIPIMDIENQVRYPSFIQYAVKERLWQESLAEELRILYVALTRAKERLFLYGSVNKLEDTLQKWQRLAQACLEDSFTDGQLRSAKTFLDWLGPALMRHPDKLFGEDIPALDLKLPYSSSQWKILMHQTINSELGTESLPESVGDCSISESTNIFDIETNPGTLNEASMELDQESDFFSALLKEVDTRLSWKYPYLEAVNQLAKTSVSELKRRLNWHIDELHTSLSITTASQSLNTKMPKYSRPKFIQNQKELTPAERGTALHSVMQHLPLETLGTLWTDFTFQEKEHYIIELLQSLVQREILTDEQRKVVSSSSILSFIDSPTGDRVLRGGEVRREVPFTLSIKLADQKNPVLIQGVIDAVILFREEGFAEVLDFKTDELRFDPDPEKTLTERYALQLALYAHAVERLLKLPVQRCTLYSTTLNKEFILPPSIIQACLNQLI